MRKTMKTALLVCLALLACTLMFTACDISISSEPATTSGTTDGNTTEDSTADGATDGTTEPETEAHVHTFGEWITVKESTTTEKGLAQRYCSECKYTESMELDLHVHSFGEWTVTTAPTCDQEGVQTRTCACGEKEEQSVAPQHQMVAEAYDIEPTCVTAGEKATEKCSICGYRNIEITAKPLGHSLSEKNNGHLCCDTCGVSTGLIYNDYSYSWHYFYVVYGSYETWEGNMREEIDCYMYYDVLVPRHDYITSILPTLFKGSRLKAITMTDNIVSIEKSAFEECDELTYVKLTSATQKIDSRAFADCIALTFIQYEGTMAEWNAIEKGTDWDAGTGNYTVYCSDGTITK